MRTRVSWLLSVWLVACAPMPSDSVPVGDGAELLRGDVDPDMMRTRRRDAGTADGDAGEATERRTDVGTATVLNTTCALGAGSLMNTRCETVRIECPGIPSIDAHLRIAERTGGTPRGVIVFGSGGAGTDFYQGSGPANRMMSELQNAGFTLVDRAWSGSGWLTGPGGTVAVSCRYSTLLTHINATLRGDGALCATGNSGGSAELGMNLGRGNGGALLDYALMSSGLVEKTFRPWQRTSLLAWVCH